MALDPSIALAYRPPQVNVDVPNPIQQFGQVLSLRNMMQQGQLGQLGLQSKMLELQQLQRTMEEQQDFAKAMRAYSQRGSTAPPPAASAAGLITPGNIDLHSRPVVKNPDGSISTVRSASFNQDGKEVLVPTVSDDGRILSNQEAWAQYQTTGKHLGIFDSPQNATAYAQQLHQDQAAEYGPRAGAPGASLSTLMTPQTQAPAAAAPVPQAAAMGAGNPRLLGMTPAQFIARFPQTGVSRVKEAFALDTAEAEAGIKLHDYNFKKADAMGRYAQAVKDSKDPPTQFTSSLMEAAANGDLDPAIARQMISDGYEKHQNDIDAFIVKAQNGKDYSEIQKNNLVANQDALKNAAVIMRGVNSQADYDTKFLPNVTPYARSVFGPTFSPQLKATIATGDVSGEKLPKAQLEQIQTDAVKLIGAIRQGPEAASNALAQMSPDSQKAFSGATTEQEVYQRAHPEVIAENLKPTGEYERDFLPAFAARLKNADGTPKTVGQLTPDQKIQAYREFKVDPAQQSLANAQKLLALVQTRMQLSQMPTAEQAQDVAKDLVAHRIAPEQMTQLFSSRGKEGMAFKLQVFNQAKKIDPEFDFEQASAEYQLTKSPTFQNTVRYMDSVQESLPQLIDRAKSLGNVGVRSINTLLNAGKDQFNSIDLKKFNTDRLLLADEVAKILQGGGTGAGTSDAKLAQAEQLFRANDDPSAIAAAADEVKQLIGYRRKALTRGTYFERTGQGGAGAAGTVKMKAPDGIVRDIPADQVEHYKSIGAKVVQ